MDLFTQLNYRYPETPKAAPHNSRSPQVSYHVPAQDIQSIQDHTLVGYVCPNPGRTMQSGPSLDFMTGHGIRPQQRNVTINPRGRGAVSFDPAGPIERYYMDESTGTSDHYIPSSSDKITCTNHSPLDEIFGHLRPSSGSSPTKSVLVHPSQNGTPRGHPRHTSVSTYALPTKPQLDGVVHIPLLAVDNHMSGTGLVVHFRCSDWGIGVEVEGIPMSDLLHGNISGLEHPHQRVLDGLGLTELRVNILWPQYPPFAKMISAFGTAGKTLTRAELGYEVSLAFAEFFYQITSQSISPARPGPYTVSLSAPGSSSPGIRFDQLHLITVRNTSRGQWMGEIRAVTLS